MEDDWGVEAVGAEGAEALAGVVPRPRLKGAGEMPVQWKEGEQKDNRLLEPHSSATMHLGSIAASTVALTTTGRQNARILRTNSKRNCT